ncbi:MAG: SDR family NAD(P)-dependent oxidoreductase [Bacteroidetes bacterium]|nr:SDR family NAD(P)-dependent oxidoreductase [Bacteroidota bacterium]MCH8524015.1 SDR family NAD(P)-dependent oxidoreductase [Balneolales bacterium]
MNLHGKVAIVTGASSGLGADFSRRLVDKGSTVFGLARRKERLDELQKELGDAFVPVVLDVTDEQAVRSWVKDTFTDLVPDILINNAGIGKFGPVDTLSTEDWHTMINLNLNAVFYLTSSVTPLLKRNENVCHIINIASIAGKLGNANLSGYNATKFALGGMSDALMKELRNDGIKVTCMYPGSIATEFFTHSGGSLHDRMMQSNDVATALINVLEMPDNFLIDEIVMRPLFPKSAK